MAASCVLEARQVGIDRDFREQEVKDGPRF